MTSSDFYYSIIGHKTLCTGIAASILREKVPKVGAEPLL